MFLTLKEKKQQKIRILVRAIVLSMNTIGLLLCLYIISILTVITKKKEAIDLLNKLLFRGGFLPEEFNTITKVAQMIIFMFMLGLSIVIYSLLVHEIQTRLHIHKLLYALGYTRLQVFFYEFTYEMWDLFLGFIVSTIVFTRLILWIIERKEITEISDVVPLYLGTYPFLYILVLFILFGLNIVCCVLKISIRKERDIFKEV